MKIIKNKAFFFLLFLLFIITLGKFSEVSIKGLNVNVVALFLFTSIVFVMNVYTGQKIYFLQLSKSLKTKFYLLLFLFVFISITRAGILNTYLFSIPLTFIALIVFIQFLSRVPLKDALQLFNVTLLILLVFNLFAFYQTGYELELFNVGNRQKRLTGIFGGGLAGAIGGLTAVYAVALYFIFNKGFHFVTLLNFILAWVVLLLSDNRTSIFACLLIYILIFMIISKQGYIYKLLLVSIIFAAVFSVSFYLTNTSRGELIQEDYNLRNYIWQIGVEQIVANPFLGSGKANPFSTNMNALMINDQIADPHNAFLFFTLKNGIIVSLMFFIFLLNFMYDSFKRIKKTKYILLIVIPIYWLIISTTGGDYFNFTLNFSSLFFGISVFGILNHPDLKIVHA